MDRVCRESPETSDSISKCSKRGFSLDVVAEVALGVLEVGGGVGEGESEGVAHGDEGGHEGAEAGDGDRVGVSR